MKFYDYRAKQQNCHFVPVRRDAKFSQIKHHWWWKANYVFDKLRVTENHNGLILLMEEDYFIAEDALHMLRLLQLRANERCPECNVFTIGGNAQFYGNYQSQPTDEVSFMWID